MPVTRHVSKTQVHTGQVVPPVMQTRLQCSELATPRGYTTAIPQRSTSVEGETDVKQEQTSSKLAVKTPATNISDSRDHVPTSAELWSETSRLR